LIYAHFSHKNDSSSISSKSLLSTSKRGRVERGVLFSLLFFRAHTLMLILMLVKKKRALLTANYEKILPSKHEEQFLILSTTNTFHYVCPNLRRYRWQLSNILVKE